MPSHSQLGLGSVQFGSLYGISNTTGQTTPSEVSQILSECISLNIRLIDTAFAYGTAEKVLGKNDLTPFKIVSKFMPPAADEPLFEQLSQSLYNLNRESLYGYLAHRPDSLSSKQWEELGEFKQRELIQKRGFSISCPNELRKLITRGFNPDIIQVPYNYFDRRFEKIMEELRRDGCEIHVRSVFLQGLFFRSAHTLPDFFDEVKPLLSSIQKTPTLSGSLLNFVLQNPFIDYVIIGVETSDQLKQNVIDLRNPIPLPNLNQLISESIVNPVNWPKD